MKKIFIILGILFCLALVGAATEIFTEPWNQNQLGDQHNLTDMDFISANTLNASYIVAEVTGSMNWTKLKNYPVSCPGSSAITTINDSTVCSDLWVDVAGDIMTGNLNSQNITPVANYTSNLGNSTNYYKNIYVGIINLITQLTDAQISDTLTASIWDGETSQADLNVNDTDHWNGLNNTSDLNNAITLTEANITDLVHTVNDTNIDVLDVESDTASITTLYTSNMTLNDTLKVDKITLIDTITFKLGEIIDNLVDGWIRIIGNLDVEGNVAINGSSFLQLEMNTTAMICNDTNAGAIYYNNNTNKHYGCNVSDWQALY